MDKVPATVNHVELLPKDLMEDEPPPRFSFCDEMESLASSFNSGELKEMFISFLIGMNVVYRFIKASLLLNQLFLL